MKNTNKNPNSPFKMHAYDAYRESLLLSAVLKDCCSKACAYYSAAVVLADSKSVIQ